MTKTKIATYLLLIPILVLGFFLFKGIKDPMDELNRIESIEARVIDKLKLLRRIQLGYYSVHGNYAKTWDELTNFVKSGRFPNIQKREIIVEQRAYGDSIRVEIDTLGTVAVRDSLFPESRFPEFNPDNLPVVPGSDGKEFVLFAAEINKSGVTIDVFEIRDPAPVNPNRRKNNNENALRVGSRDEATVAGNFE